MKKKKISPAAIVIAAALAAALAVIVILSLRNTAGKTNRTAHVAYTVRQDVSGGSVRTDYSYDADGNVTGSSCEDPDLEPYLLPGGEVQPMTVLLQMLEARLGGISSATCVEDRPAQLNMADGTEYTLVHLDDDYGYVMETDVLDTDGGEVVYAGFDFDLNMILSSVTLYSPDETELGHVSFTYNSDGTLLRATYYENKADLLYSVTYYYE